MQLASTTVRKHKIFLATAFLFSFFFTSLNAQDNSPYSRYGLGSLYPRMNVINRGMGGVSAAYGDVFSINYNNPASYAGFQVNTEQRSGKVSSGRVILDAALNFDSRKLSEPNTTRSFRANDLLFSHVYVGLPIRKNWGVSFGIRPLSRVGYNIFRREKLQSSSTGQDIDSIFTQYQGTGGSFLPTIGTGFGNNNFRIGANIGYLFGKKELTTRRVFLSDSLEYAASNHTTNTNFGNLFFTVGSQYLIDLSPTSVLRLGASGNWKQTLGGTQDVMRQTYTRDASGQELRVDSVFQKSDIAGNIVYPATYTVGFLYDHAPGERARGWNIGVDYVAGKWDNYRFFGAKDFVQNNWELRVGAQITPSYTAIQNGRLVNYRFGFFTGRDYVRIDRDLPVYGVSFGLGLPLRNYSRLTSQQSIINIGAEYVRRGNDQNTIKEDMYRISIGLNFTDFWFGKRKYD